MTAVLSEIDRIKRQEQAAAWDKNERALLEKLEPLPRIDLAEHKAHVDLFIDWCSKSGVRHCVSRPWVVATFISEHAHRGEEFALNAINAIEALHSYHGQPSPVATQQVRAELDKIIKPEAPRSWTKAEKEMFSTLPSDIRAAINRREREREKNISRLQNENAEIRRELSAQIIKTKAGPASNGAEPIKGTERTSEPSGASAG